MGVLVLNVAISTLMGIKNVNEKSVMKEKTRRYYTIVTY